MNPANHPVLRTERGWPAHYCAAGGCTFRRNTLLTCGDNRVIVSTVGNLRTHDGGLEEVGAGRFYETMCFSVVKIPDTGYYDADTTSRVPFESPWALSLSPTIDSQADLVANTMHENVAEEIAARLLAGELVCPVTVPESCDAEDE